MQSLVRHLTRPLQLGLSLVLLNMSVLFVADFLSLRGDTSRSVHDARAAFAVALVGQLSTLANANDLPGIERAILALVELSVDVEAAALTLDSGVMLVGHGAVERLEGEGTRSDGTRLTVPIYRDNRTWGEVQIAFTSNRRALGTLGDVGWLAFIAIASLVSFGVFLGKVLVQLDPGSAVPEQVDSAFDLFSAGVVILDEELRIVMANEAASTIGKRPARALMGLPLESAFTFDENEDEDWQTPWATTLHSGLIASDQQLSVRGSEGELRLYSVSCAPVGDEAGGRRGVLVTLDDMTQIEQRNTELATTLEALRVSRDEIEVRSAELELLATTDSMTGAANRRTFLERLAVEIERARDECLPLSCVMTDIDHFKRVNDTYGHPTGDAVICAVANALRGVCREVDLAARFGGEEFVLLLPGLDAKAAFEVAERVRTAVIALAAGDTLPVPKLSASLGVAELAADMTDPSSIVDAADKALYVSKESGRNRVSIYSEDENGEGDEGSTPGTPAPALAVLSESERLPARVIELEAELQEREREVAVLREFDTLTGVPMRVLFLQRAAAELTRARRTGALVGIMSFELRELGRVVATFGHEGSDALVVAFVERLQKGLRSSDLVSRIAADHNLSRIMSNEYGVLLADVHEASGALIVVARLKRLLSQPFELAGERIYLGVNIGIALSARGDAVEAAALFEQASEARHKAASKSDKISHAFAAVDLDNKSHDYIRLESDLHDAFEAGTLETYFQPKFDLRARRVTGVEALVRWEHETRGFVPPNVLVAIAEANGLMGRLSSLMLERTLAQLLVWRSMGFDDLRASINVSPMQLRDESLVDDTLEALRRSGLPGHQLEIELTETSLLECPEEARGTLEKLREVGMQVSIDDFGTGYTSLSLLANLPLDIVKIDRSFIVAMAEGERSQAIVESIITMAHALGLRVVGEGIETNEQLEAMARLGCDEIQGYLISRPLPADKITAFIVHQRNERERRRA